MTNPTNTPDLLPCPFKFGDLLENGHASDDNPRKRGWFIRKGHSSGKLNPGHFIELTDGNGKMWQHPWREGHKLTIVSTRPAPAVTVKPEFGPQFPDAPMTCLGCSAHSSEPWREPSGDGETYDTGDYNRCSEKGGEIIDGAYGSARPTVPDWCPHPRILSAIQPEAPNARDEALRERLADLEHQQWAHWTGYMLGNMTVDNHARWVRQIGTPYADLTEKEKDSDRTWADKVIALIDKPAPAPTPQVPEDLLKQTFAIQYNPNCPSPWLVRLCGKSCVIDMKPYTSLTPASERTVDILGFGKTIEEAATSALSEDQP